MGRSNKYNRHLLESIQYAHFNVDIFCVPDFITILTLQASLIYGVDLININFHPLTTQRVSKNTPFNLLYIINALTFFKGFHFCELRIELLNSL